MARLRGPDEPIVRHTWHGANSRFNRPAQLATRRHREFRHAMVVWPIITFGLIFFNYDRLQSLWTVATVSAEQRLVIEQSVYYAGCDAVRAANKAPLFAGQPGYRSGMDGDGDGIACEPLR